MIVGGGDGIAPILVGVNGMPGDVRTGEDRGINALAVDVLGDQKRGIAAGRAAGRRAVVFALDAHGRNVTGVGNDVAVAFGVDLPVTQEVRPEFGPDIGQGVVNVRGDDAGRKGRRGSGHKKQRWKSGTAGGKQAAYSHEEGHECRPQGGSPAEPQG